MYINNLGHMTKMATMPRYGKNPSKIFFSLTNRLISRKHGVKHRWLKYSNVYINHDPVMTLTQFMARSTCVAHAFEWGKTVKISFEGKSAPALGLNAIILKHVYWYMQQISGERLHDHWSSGVFFNAYGLMTMGHLPC